MPLGSFIEDGAGPAVGLRLSTQATPSGPIRALGPGCQPHKGRMAGAQPCRGRPFSSPPRPGGGGPRSRPGWSASPRCRPLRPSVVPAVPRPAGGSPPPDSGDARQGSSGTAACPPWPSGTPSWATRARCRPPQPDGGSGEDQVRPYRWIGLPRRIPFVRRTRRLYRVRSGPGVRPATKEEGVSATVLAVTLPHAGLTGRSCRPAKLPAIVRLGRFSVPAT
jgi:hypothetical protein